MEAFHTCSVGITGNVAKNSLIMTVPLKNAAVGIVTNNLTSGNIKPTRAEEVLKLKIASNFLDIKLIDLLLISENGYFSSIGGH